MVVKNPAAHLRFRIVEILADAGFQGVKRTKLIKSFSGGTTQAGDYATAARALDRFHGQGRIEKIRGCYRLAIGFVDQLHTWNPEAVAHWFDLDTLDGQAFQQWRIDTYMHDVIPPPIGVKPPPYHHSGVPVEPPRDESDPETLAKTSPRWLTAVPDVANVTGLASEADCRNFWVEPDEPVSFWA